jgi:hypothetical protein
MNWYRGFRRLAFVAWAIGLSGALYAGWVIHDPRALIHPASAPEPCLDQEPPGGGLLRLSSISVYCPRWLRPAGARPDWVQPDWDSYEVAHEGWEAELVPAYQTLRYWRGLGLWLGYAAVGSGVFWGAFYVTAWIARGFRRSS